MLGYSIAELVDLTVEAPVFFCLLFLFCHVFVLYAVCPFNASGHKPIMENLSLSLFIIPSADLIQTARQRLTNSVIAKRRCGLLREIPPSLYL